MIFYGRLWRINYMSLSMSKLGGNSCVIVIKFYVRLIIGSRFSQKRSDCSLSHHPPSLLFYPITGSNKLSVCLWLGILLSANRKPLQCLCPCVTLPVLSGSIGTLIAERGRLPEDQGLHYQVQVLQALEYLAKKKVAHLDIKGKIKIKKI